MIKSSSQDWNEWNRGGGPRYPNSAVVQFCFRAFPPETRRHKRALDFGCGSGVHTLFLAHEGFSVTGIDIAETGIENTRERLKAYGLHAELFARSIDDPQLPLGSFDLIICDGVLDSAGPSISTRAIHHASTLLAPGGRGIFIFASDQDFRVLGENPMHIHGFSRDEVENLFSGNFDECFVDRSIITYRSGELALNNWLVTVRRFQAPEVI